MKKETGLPYFNNTSLTLVLVSTVNGVEKSGSQNGKVMVFLS